MKLPMKVKLGLYGRIGWGIIMSFVLFGNLLGKTDIAIMLAILVGLLWVIIRIINEAIDALQLLQAPDEDEREP